MVVKNGLGRAKGNRVYLTLDMLELYEISANTLTAWIRLGLSRSDSKRPYAFRGAELNRFHAHTSDPGELARSALLESLSIRLRDRLLSLLEPTPQEIRKASAAFSGGQVFAGLARDFFARLTFRSLDYYLSRELANHTGAGKRFADDAARVEFERALSQHTFEASRIVEEFAGGWYGKTVWKEQTLSQNKISEFTRYAFKKMRSELGRRRASA
ncbi:MAG: hypothetical protein ABJL99_16690 [Aliishimia sp.]